MNHLPEAHTRTGAFLPRAGATLADHVGARLLVRPSDPFHSHLMEMSIAEASRSGLYARTGTNGNPAHAWVRCDQYVIIEVLEPWVDNNRALAQLHGLLGTPDVRAVRNLLAALAATGDAETKERIATVCPKLGRKANGELQTANPEPEPAEGAA
jgi:hypothetical protein